MRMDLLKRENLEDGRFARIPYLERVIHTNLSKANRVLRVLRCHAAKLGLKESHSEYRKWGKGGRRIHLRFSKYGDPGMEAAYSRHFVRLPAAHGEADRRAAGTESSPDGPQSAEPKARGPMKYTLTVDASCPGGLGMMGIGILIQASVLAGRRGPVIDRLSEQRSALKPAEAEQLAVLRALEVASERGYRRVRVRTDCRELVRKLQERHKKAVKSRIRRENRLDKTPVVPKQPTGLRSDRPVDMTGRILELAASFEECLFRGLIRRKNLEAKVLARGAVKPPEST